MDIKRVKTVRERNDISLTGKDIIQLLINNGDIPAMAPTSISFTVPGGGDWSGMSVDIDKDNPVNIVYEVTTTDKGE